MVSLKDSFERGARIFPFFSIMDIDNTSSFESNISNATLSERSEVSGILNLYDKHEEKKF
jgi:hypothetical protein